MASRRRSLPAALVARARLAGAAERIRAAVGTTTREVDADEHAARIYAEVERARLRALTSFVEEQTSGASTPNERCADAASSEGA